MLVALAVQNNIAGLVPEADGNRIKLRTARGCTRLCKAVYSRVHHWYFSYMSVAILEEYRPALTGHCYRMLGSVLDAEDAVQETMFRAWKAMDRFREQASLKTWLYRIATNVCLDVLTTTKRQRIRPVEASPTPGVVHDDLVLETRSKEHWVEPIPDAMALPSEADCDPGERVLLSESIRLAFVAALQYLPPRQRAVLLLTQVLGWSAAETASSLEMTVSAVNSALQRARADLVGESADLLARLIDVGGDGRPLRAVARPLGRAERHVQHGAILGAVHRLAGVEALARRLDARRAGQVQGVLEVGQRPGLLGQVQRQAGGAHGEAVEPRRLLIEQAGDASDAGAFGGGVQGGPGGVEFGQA